MCGASRGGETMKYICPELEIIVFGNEDIVRTSIGTSQTKPEEDDYDFSN